VPLKKLPELAAPSPTTTTPPKTTAAAPPKSVAAAPTKPVAAAPPKATATAPPKNVAAAPPKAVAVHPPEAVSTAPPAATTTVPPTAAATVPPTATATVPVGEPPVSTAAVPPSAAVPGEPSPEMVAAVEHGIAGSERSTVGAAGEAAAAAGLREAEHEVFDLNQLRIDLERVRSNFPLLDLSSKGPAGSPGVFASVKNYAMGTTGPLPKRTLRRYTRDIKSMLKTGGPGLAPVPAEKAGELMAANRAQVQAADAWPRDLPLDADARQIAGYINEKGVLVIPDDHVPQVRTFMREQALRDPGAYELENAPDLEAAIAGLQERVQPMGMTSGQLNDIHRRVTGAP
jgi:hypothetical protein